MFAAVKFEEKEKSFLSFWRKSRILSERINLPNGESFFLITAEKRGDKIPFDRIFRFARSLQHSLIFPSDCTFPSGSDYMPYKPRDLREKLLASLAEKVLPQINISPAETSVCLCDGGGIYKDELHRLVPLASKIHVVCSQKQVYEAELERLFFNYGCSVTMSEKFDKTAENSNVIISHSGEDVPLIFSGIIFTNKKRPYLTNRIYGVESVNMPYEYEKLRPSYIDKITFASALYEKCKVSPEIFILDNLPQKDIY